MQTLILPLERPWFGVGSSVYGLTRITEYGVQYPSRAGGGNGQLVRFGIGSDATEWYPVLYADDQADT